MLFISILLGWSTPHCRQWGYNANPQQGANVVRYPIAFPTNVFAIFTAADDSSTVTWDLAAASGNPTKEKMGYFSFAGGNVNTVKSWWLAIGN